MIANFADCEINSEKLLKVVVLELQYFFDKNKINSFITPKYIIYHNKTPIYGLCNG